MDDTLLSRIEDAGLNASATPQQQWLDGWLLRLCPGKAKRARCVNALAPGRLALDNKLRLATAVFSRAGLPLLVRITPFTQPTVLDAQLAARGYTAFDDTRVMVCSQLQTRPSRALVSGIHWLQLDAWALAEAAGELRDTPAEQRLAHAQRMASVLSACNAQAICRDADTAVLACGQAVQEAELVGLYDVVTRETARRQGLATQLCERLLSDTVNNGATVAYLQVDGQNDAARRIYQRMGFVDAYAYHYRIAPGVTPN